MNFPSIKSRILTTVYLLFSLSVSISCQNTVLPPSPPDITNQNLSPAVIPTPRNVEFDWMSIAQWYHQFAEQVAVAHNADAELLFLGDSITNSWTWNDGHDAVFKEFFGQYNSANFGIGGDQTQNLLWRLQNGLDGELDPAVVVILIGVNNFGHSNQSAQAVFAGIKAVVEQAHINYPNAKILLNGIFPYDEYHASPNRLRVKETNALAAQLGDEKTVFFRDFGAIYLNQQGDIPKELMTDFLHPTAKGLRLFAEQISPLIKNWIDQAQQERQFIAANNAMIQTMGRTVVKDDGAQSLGYPGVTLTLNVKAKKLALIGTSTSGENYFDVIIDDQPAKVIRLPTSAKETPLFRGDAVEHHRVQVIHRSETWHGISTLRGFVLTEGELLPPPPLPERKLLVIGDSVTCGEAIDRVVPSDGSQCKKDKSWWNAKASYGMLLGEALNAQTQLVCHGGRGLVRSWNGKTDEHNTPDFYPLAISEASGSFPWPAARYPADLVLVSVGTNDFGPGIPERSHYVKTYVKFAQKLLADFPSAHIVLTEGAIVSDNNPSLPQKTTLQEYLYATQKHVASPRLHVVPSRHYGGDACDGHPTRESHAKMAQDFEQPLKNIMAW